MRIARDDALPFSLRYAALQALGRSPDVEAELISDWLALIEDETADIALRSSALEAMSELGSRAFAAQPRLLALFPRLRDDTMLGSLARTLVAIAPASAPVSSVLLEKLKQTSVDSPLFVDLVVACSGMGRLQQIASQSFCAALPMSTSTLATNVSKRFVSQA